MSQVCVYGFSGDRPVAWYVPNPASALLISFLAVHVGFDAKNSYVTANPPAFVDRLLGLIESGMKLMELLSRFEVNLEDKKDATRTTLQSSSIIRKVPTVVAL